MIQSRIFGGTTSRNARRPSPHQGMAVEPLEGRQLQSGIGGVVAVTPAIVGGQGVSPVTPDCGIIKCGGHLGG